MNPETTDYILNRPLTEMEISKRKQLARVVQHVLLDIELESQESPDAQPNIQRSLSRHASNREQHQEAHAVVQTLLEG